MAKLEILNTTVGEIYDMIACYDIDHGRSDPKPKPLTYDQAIALR